MRVSDVGRDPPCPVSQTRAGDGYRRQLHGASLSQNGNCMTREGRGTEVGPRVRRPGPGSWRPNQRVFSGIPD